MIVEIIISLIVVGIIIVTFFYGYFVGKSRGIKWTNDIYKRSNLYDEYTQGMLLRYCLKIQNLRLCAFLNKKPEKEEIDELMKQEELEHKKYTSEMNKILKSK